MGERPVVFKLVHEQALVGVGHGRDGIHPLPPFRDAAAFEEIATEEEEERGESDDCSIAQYVVGHHRTDKHHEWIGGEQRDVENDDEVVEVPVEFECEPDDCSVCQGLDQEEGEVGDEAWDGIWGGAVRVVWRLSNEYEALLDESRDGVIGREKEETDGEDDEAEASGDSLGVILGIEEHGGHHEPHDC